MQRNDEAPSAPSAVTIEDPGKREFLKTFGTVGLGMGVGLGLPAAGIVNDANRRLGRAAAIPNAEQLATAQSCVPQTHAGRAGSAVELSGRPASQR